MTNLFISTYAFDCLLASRSFAATASTRSRFCLRTSYGVPCASAILRFEYSSDVKSVWISSPVRSTSMEPPGCGVHYDLPGQYLIDPYAIRPMFFYSAGRAPPRSDRVDTRTREARGAEAPNQRTARGRLLQSWAARLQVRPATATRMPQGHNFNRSRLCACPIVKMVIDTIQENAPDAG